MAPDLALFLVALVAGGVASVTGFGIGSLVTPVLMLRYPAGVAIAMVAIPHALGTALRFWRLRPHLDPGVFRSFGLASAVGGLTGALLHGRLDSIVLTVVFGGLLVMSGVAGLLDLPARWRGSRGAIGSDGRRGHLAALLGGALSGGFGGLAGNQGGIRSAALLAFPLTPLAFVATATATGLVVDAVRLPLYLANNGPALLGAWREIVWASIGVLAGTVLGARLLTRLPGRTFRVVVAGAVLVLGVAILLASR